MDFAVKRVGENIFRFSQRAAADYRPDLSGKEKGPNVKLFFGRRWGGCSRVGFFWVSFFRGLAFVCGGRQPTPKER